MNSGLNLPPKDMKPSTHSTQPPIKTSSPHINQPDSNQQNDQHASQPEFMASVSQYFAPMQDEFVEECKHYEQHLRQDCDKFASIQSQIIELSDALADQLLTKSKLQQQLDQVKKDKTAQINSELETLKQQLQDHFGEYAQLRVQHGMQRAEEYHVQHIIPLELQRDELAKDIEHIESTDEEIISIKQEIDGNSKSIQELENTLEKLMRDLRLKAGGSYLDNINKVLALKAEIANLNQDIIKMRDEQRDQLIQKEADIAAIREDMKGQTKEQMKELADQMNAEILAIRHEMKQHLGTAGAQALTASQPSTNLISWSFNRYKIVYIVIFISLSFLLLNSFRLTSNNIGDVGAQADQFTAQMERQARQNEQLNAEILTIRNEMKQQGGQFRAQDGLQKKVADNEQELNQISEQLKEVKQHQTDLKSRLEQAQFPSSVTPNTTEELFHLITAPQGSPILMSVTSLDLSKCKLGDKMANFFKSVFKMPNLTSLSLSGNEIGDAGAQALAASPALTKLMSLNIRGNKIGDAGVQFLATSPTLTNLTSLNLDINNVGPAGVRALVASTTLINLTSLDLSVNTIGDAGAQALAASQTFINLTSLDLRFNNIGDSGAQALAAPKTLTNLTSLDLRGNGIGVAGAQFLLASKTFTNITSLDLRGNKIGAAGAQAMKTKYPFVSV